MEESPGGVVQRSSRRPIGISVPNVVVPCEISGSCIDRDLKIHTVSSSISAQSSKQDRSSRARICLSRRRETFVTPRTLTSSSIHLVHPRSSSGRAWRRSWPISSPTPSSPPTRRRSQDGQGCGRVNLPMFAERHQLRTRRSCASIFVITYSSSGIGLRRAGGRRRRRRVRNPTVVNSPGGVLNCSSAWTNAEIKTRPTVRPIAKKTVRVLTRA